MATASGLFELRIHGHHPFPANVANKIYYSAAQNAGYVDLFSHARTNFLVFSAARPGPINIFTISGIHPCSINNSLYFCGAALSTGLPGTVYRSNFDFTHTEALASGFNLSDISIDEVNQAIYFGGISGIYKTDLDFRDIQLIIPLVGTQPPSGLQFLHVEPKNSGIYYSLESISGDDEVWRADLDGSNKLPWIIEHSEKLYDPRGLTVDDDIVHVCAKTPPLDNRGVAVSGTSIGQPSGDYQIYYTRPDQDDSTHDIVASQRNNSRYIYSKLGNIIALTRYHKESGATSTVFTAVNLRPGYINLSVQPNDIPLQTLGHILQSGSVTLFCSGVDNRSFASGEMDMFVRGHRKAPSDIANKFYYTLHNRIGFFDIVSKASGIINTIPFGGNSAINGIGQCLINDKIYFAHNTSGILFRSNYDGSNPEIIVSGQTELFDIIIDQSGVGAIYFSTRDNIKKCDLDGGNLQTLFTESPPASSIKHIAADFLAGRIYRSRNINPSQESSEVFRCNIDGSNNAEVADQGQFLSDDLRGLDILPPSDKLYIINTQQGIWYNIDEPIDTGLFEEAHSWASPITGEDLIYFNSKIYYIESSGITQSLIKQFSPSVLFFNPQTSGLRYLSAIAFPNTIDFRIRGKDTNTNTVDLFIHGKDTASSGIDLYISGYETSSGIIHLSIVGHETQSGVCDLFTHGFDISSGVIPLSINGFDTANNNIDLFVNGHEQQSGVIDLFIVGFDTVSNNIDLFVNGHETQSQSIDLSINGFNVSSGFLDLIITGHNSQSGFIDLIINGFDTQNNNLDLFIHGFDIASGIVHLFIKSEISVIDEDISLFIEGDLSSIITLFIPGRDPALDSSCPILDVNASIQISNELIDIYQSRIDALINQIGSHLILNFNDSLSECPNCGYNSISEKSDGIYKSGGPIPFSLGQRCPYCKGKGILRSQVQKCIHALVQFDTSNSSISLQQNVGNLAGRVRVKTLFEYADDIIRSVDAFLQPQLNSTYRIKLRKVSGPVPVGLREDRYCVSFWDIVNT